MKSDFFSQYKHPNWQRKRLEALESAGFCCQLCGSNEETLHVHHKRYVKGRKVWEYDVKELAALCESCHASTHQSKDILNEIIANIDPEGLIDIAALVAGYCSKQQGPAWYLHPEWELIKEESPTSFAAGVIASGLAMAVYLAKQEGKSVADFSVSVAEFRGE